MLSPGHPDPVFSKFSETNFIFQNTYDLVDDEKPLMRTSGLHVYHDGCHVHYSQRVHQTCWNCFCGDVHGGCDGDGYDVYYYLTHCYLEDDEIVAYHP